MQRPWPPGSSRENKRRRPRAGYTIALQPVLRRFLDRCSEVKFEMRIENQLVDNVGQGFDAGLRFGDLVEKDIIAVKIGPHIFAQHHRLPRIPGTPTHPHDLLARDCIAFRHANTGQTRRWLLARIDRSVVIAVRHPSLTRLRGCAQPPCAIQRISSASSELRSHRSHRAHLDTRPESNVAGHLSGRQLSPKTESKHRVTA